MKTKDRYLGLLQSLLAFHSSSIIRLPRGLVSTRTTRGVKYLHVLYSYQGVLVLSQPSDVSNLVPSHLVSISLLSPTSSTASHICLSQAYGYSDHYTLHCFPVNSTQIAEEFREC